MQKKRLWNGLWSLVVAVVVVASGASALFAVDSSSTNYQVTETQFGSGDTLESCSGQYCARASIGDIAAGQSKNESATATFGSVTDGEPVLEVIVEPGESDLGVLSTERTATKTTVVRIRNYLSDGYMLQIIGDPPKYGDHTLAVPSTPTASSQGTEQFAINAATNTVPGVGADPQQIPSNQMSFGVVEDDYRTPNLFMYRSGAVVARSSSESGRTDYTISMIVNIANSTPAGHYSSDFSAVVIPVY